MARAEAGHEGFFNKKFSRRAVILGAAIGGAGLLGAATMGHERSRTGSNGKRAVNTAEPSQQKPAVTRSNEVIPSANNEVLKSVSERFKKLSSISFKNPEGESVKFDIENYKGRPLVVAVWSTIEPGLTVPQFIEREIKPKFGDNVQFVILATYSEQKDVKAFVDRAKKKEGIVFSTPILIDDKEAKAAVELGLRGLPTYFVLDSEMRVRHSLVGIQKTEDVILAITDVVGTSQK